jgi:hypothetical protein
MADLGDKFLETLSLLFDPFFSMVAAACLGLGFAARKKIPILRGLVFGGLIILSFFFWMQICVFAYPPNVVPPQKWLIAGFTYTDGAVQLAAAPRFRGLSQARRNSELVYASGGDPENVWEGWSIQVVEIGGKLVIALLAFVIGTLPGLKKET